MPAGSGPFPTVVLVRGGPSGPGGRAYLEPFARELAAAGALVFSADMSDTASLGGGYPRAFEDVACAVRYARGHATEYRGDDAAVTLVGHSLGGFVGSVVAIDEHERGADCLADGDGRPDAFVGLAGNYRLEAAEVARDLEVFYGGGPAATARARAASDPLRVGATRPIPVRLVAGTNDTTVLPAASRALFASLRARGWDVDLQLVAGGDHGSIIVPGRDGPGSVRTVLATTRLAARPRPPHPRAVTR